MTNETKEAVGVFPDLEKLDEAVSELKANEFARHDITVLGTEKEVKETFGVQALDPEWLEDNPNAPRSISVRPEEKTIGASVLVGVPAYFGGCVSILAVNPASDFVVLGAVAAGSLFGAALGTFALSFIRRQLKTRIERQIREGGLPLWVNTPNRRKERIATRILNRYGARHVHIHSIA